MRLFSRINDNFILLVLFFVFLNVSHNRNSIKLEGVIWSDVEGYYMYLPAVFINHDLHSIPKRSMDCRKNDKGELVMKYTCGVAFFYLPFFLVAHMYATVYHYDTSGFSDPYYYGMILCGVFWAFIGLYLLKKLLLKYFDRLTTWVTLLCILFGTNFFHYATKSPGMSHVYSFALVSGILLLIQAYYKSPGKGKAILLGLLIGWLVLIRPTNCLFLLFLLLFNVVSLSDFKQRLLFLKSRISDILIGIPFFVLVMFPQMLYWKALLGKWIVYSYDGEGFIYWKNPKILAVLADTQNGLFLYSPVLLLMFLGFMLARKDRRTNIIGVSVVFIIATYLFASWWAWWFGAAFGHRSYVEYFPLFAFPMAVAVEKVAAMKRLYLQIPLALGVILLCYYSVQMSLLTDTRGIWDGPNWRWNYREWVHEVKLIFKSHKQL